MTRRLASFFTFSFERVLIGILFYPLLFDTNPKDLSDLTHLLKAFWNRGEKLTCRLTSCYSSRKHISFARHSCWVSPRCRSSLPLHLGFLCIHRDNSRKSTKIIFLWKFRMNLPRNTSDTWSNWTQSIHSRGFSICSYRTSSLSATSNYWPLRACRAPPGTWTRPPW